MNILANNIIIKLKKEAEALYSTGIGNDCPYKYFNQDRKVWWVIDNYTNNFTYTICQECYHKNNSGDRDIS